MTEPIIAARAGHALVLAAIHADAFPPGEAWGPDAMALTLALPGAFGLLWPGAGMALLRVAAAEAEVLTLAVAQASRRSGIARALLRDAMDAAARRGASEMFLEVSTGNAAARLLYAAAGFEVVGRRRRYYADGTDAEVMRAPLKRPGAGAAA